MTKPGFVAMTLMAGISVSVWAQTAAQTPPPPAAAAEESVTFVGAGDIAKCDIIGGAVGTARVLDQIPGTVFTVGDNAYPDGTAKDFADCYGPTWGRHKARTRPVPGNHDYHTRNAQPYFDYFGELAGPPNLGYYSYDLGAWHILAVNSVIDSDKRSAQYKWIEEDLKAHPAECTLAYWHVPIFSSGTHGSDWKMRDVWRLLYAHGVDLVLNGHDHNYERFAPQDPEGKADPLGIREFIIGTGGGGVYRPKGKQPNSEVWDNTSYGVLKLTLSPGSYTWEFVPIPGMKFKDSGTGTCSPLR